MPHRRIRLNIADTEVQAGLDRIRTDLKVPAGFSAAAGAEAAATRDPAPGLGLRGLEFFTLDPAGSMDLDQAMFLERLATGYRVWYAIADVAAFVRPGGAVDAESQQRGVTLYLPDEKSPLHPPELSEGAASLLPGVDRPAVVWRIDLDGTGRTLAVDLRRALVQSRERLDYATVSAGDPRIALLEEIGTVLIEQEAARGGVSLPLPEQDVLHDADGWRLEFRDGLGSEQWNAQISLLAGRAAAQIMLKGGVGLLRTMPPPQKEAVARLRRIAQALGITWAENQPYGEIVRQMDNKQSRHVAFLHEAASLMRGAGYTAFNGTPPEGHAAQHAAVASPYAHVTAPLRRLADRYATEICLALTAGEPVPDWVLAALPTLPATMERTLRHSGEVERACLDLVEAVLLKDRIGEEFDAVVVESGADPAGAPDARRSAGTVQILDPAVLAKCTGEHLPLGEPVRVRLTDADPLTRRVRFAR
ncbi:MAG: RNB domain-containing ribonuclease [Streptosporangiaceae bacterium]